MDQIGDLITAVDYLRTNTLPRGFSAGNIWQGAKTGSGLLGQARWLEEATRTLMSPHLRKVVGDDSDFPQLVQYLGDLSHLLRSIERVNTAHNVGTAHNLIGRIFEMCRRRLQ
jgi:hypothetical protein